MSDINITALIAQMPYVQSMANVHVVQPDAQQYFAAHMAQQVFRQQHEQVQKIEKQEDPHAVRKDPDGGGRNRGSRQDQPKRHAAPEEDSPPDPGNSPWIGHLVNKKV